MSCVNYAKWDTINDSDDDSSDKKALFDINLMHQWKRAADNLFEIGENEDVINHYKNAQSSYQRVVSEIELNISNSIIVDNSTLSLLFSCQLNILTCFAKLNDWKNVINRAEVHIKHYESMFFDEHYKVISKEQFIRLLYFIIHANINIDTHISISNAIKYASIMKKMLELIPYEGMTSQISNDYNKTFELLEKKKKMFNAKEERYEIEYYSNIIYSLFQNKQYDDVIIACKKFMHDYQLHDLPNNEIMKKFITLNNHSFDSNLLSNIFYSYADAMVNIDSSDSSDVADSLVRGAYFCQTNDKKISLYVRAATLYYNNKKYNDAIESYNLVLNTSHIASVNGDMLEIHFGIIFAIAKVGLGSSFIAIGDDEKALVFLEDAINFFECHILDSHIPDFQIYMHSLNCYESLVQCYCSLQKDDNCIRTYKKIIALCNNYNSIFSGASLEQGKSSTIIKGKIIKYSIALVSCLQQDTKELKEYILDLQETTTLLCDEINDIGFISSLKQLRLFYLDYSNAFPYKYNFKQEIYCENNYSERGHDFCRLIGRKMLNKVIDNDVSKQLLEETIYTIYDAGILSLNYSLNEAIRSFESCLETISHYSHQCSDCFLGDIHYHNSFCYLRQHNFLEARNEIELTVNSLQQIKDKDAQRFYHAFSLAAVIYTTTNEIKAANGCIDTLVTLSQGIGPIVDDNMLNEIKRLKVLLHAKSFFADNNKELNVCINKPIEISNHVEKKKTITFDTRMKYLFNVAMKYMDLNLCIAMAIVFFIYVIKD